MDMRVSRATAVVVQRVPAESAEWFMEWQRGVSAASEAFSGHLGTDVYPPPGGKGGDWVAVITFDDEKSLQVWLDSPVRKQWVDKLQAHIGSFDLKVTPGGLGPWFAGCMQGSGAAAVPGWKMVLVVLLGLYPTVMLLTLFPGPYTQHLGLAVSMLIGNALSVSALQWVVMPVLNVLSRPWLAANGEEHKTYSRAGLVVIVTLLFGLTVFFHGLTG